jgi:serine/threonine protein kinase
MAIGDTALRRSDPQWLGDYRLAARLGQGSQGAVYLAEGPDGERVAIKLLHGDLADSPQLRERFVREAALARMVEPFYIAQVLVTGMYGDVPYIVSEYVEGPSLQQAIIRHGPSSAAGLSRLAVATATALTAIHDAGVVHRDFKPGNVVLGPDGPRVIDFGIARSLDGDQHTLTHGIIGTPAYMAPEQARGLAVTSAADMYAWACMIVFAATGKPPFDADDKAVPHTRPELDYLGGRLRSAVEACLVDDPVKRPTAPQVLTRLIQNQSLAPSSERSSVQNILETAGDAQIDHATE